MLWDEVIHHQYTCKTIFVLYFHSIFTSLLYDYTGWIFIKTVPLYLTIHT